MMSNDSELKFVKKDSLTSLFDSLMNKENSDRSSSTPIVSTFDPAKLTECPRRIIYRSRGNKEDGQSQDYLEHISRKASIEKWVNYIVKSKHFKAIEKFMCVADCNYNIVGTLDLLININDKNIAVKIYPVGLDTFSKITSYGAIKKHVIETLAYMWLSEVYDGIILYDCMENNKWLTFHVEPYRPIIESIKKKCLEMVDHKIKGTIPSRPYKSKTSKECGVCEFKNECWRANEK